MEYAQDAIYLVVGLFLVMELIRHKPGGGIDFLDGRMAASGVIGVLTVNDSSRLGRVIRRFSAADKSVPIAASHEKTERTFIFELKKRQRSFEDQASTFGLAVS